MKVRWVDHVACMGNKKNIYSFLVAKPKTKVLVGKPRITWENNSKM
jgi:hypothetical protein